MGPWRLISNLPELDVSFSQSAVSMNTTPGEVFHFWL